MNALSVSELARMDLTVLPKTSQAIGKRAKKEAWPYQEVASQARGGKLKKYLVSGLPAEIQTAIKEKQAADLLAAAEPVGLPAVANAPVRRGVFPRRDATCTDGGHAARCACWHRPRRRSTTMSPPATRSARRCRCCGSVAEGFMLGRYTIGPAVLSQMRGR